jgi:hypothetical protein
MKRFIMATLLASSIAGTAHSLTAVRPIDGYICMSLKWTGSEQDMWDESKLPSVFEQPTSSSKKIGYVGVRAIVVTPLHVENGFAEILHLNGQKGWVEAALLQPYPPAKNRSETCIPSIMDNGRIGFGVAPK